jgi:hypothetical protein
MQKRSSKKRQDFNELAADIVDQATDEEPEDDQAGEPEVDDGKNPAAVALGRLGGLKGGKARAKKLTKKQRSDAARKAALARWEKKSPSDD